MAQLLKIRSKAASIKFPVGLLITFLLKRDDIFLALLRAPASFAENQTSVLTGTTQAW